MAGIFLKFGILVTQSIVLLSLASAFLDIFWDVSLPDWITYWMGRILALSVAMLLLGVILLAFKHEDEDVTSENNIVTSRSRISSESDAGAQKKTIYNFGFNTYVIGAMIFGLTFIISAIIYLIMLGLDVRVDLDAYVLALFYIGIFLILVGVMIMGIVRVGRLIKQHFN